MEFIAILLILLVAARLVGELFERLNQPAMAGEILVGVILGPSVLSVIDPNIQWLEILSNLGLFFIVFLAGVEMSFRHIKKNHRPAISIALMSFVCSFACGVLLGTVLHYDARTSVVMGLVFSLSALPIAVRILMDINRLETRVGRLTIISAVIDDILAMIFLSVVISLAKHSITGESLFGIDVVYTIIKIMVFLAIIYLIDKLLSMHYGLPSMYIKHYIRKFRSKEAQFSVILIFGLIVGAVGEMIGITFIIGAFYAGLLIDRDTIGEDAYKKTSGVLSTISSGFLAPIFFAYIGLMFYLPSIFNYSAPLSTGNAYNMGILALIVIFAIFGKTLGSYAGARLANVPKDESLAIGIGLNARGLMGIVIALVAYENDLIDQTIFSMLVAMSIITTLIAPVILKRYMKRIPPEPPVKKTKRAIDY